MKINPMAHLQERYISQDIMVTSMSSVSLNRSYRDVNQPIHVEPAAKIQLSQEALDIIRSLKSCH